MLPLFGLALDGDGFSLVWFGSRDWIGLGRLGLGLGLIWHGLWLLLFLVWGWKRGSTVWSMYSVWTRYSTTVSYPGRNNP